MQYRHEYKHEINYADYLLVKSRLKAVMKLDDHVGEDGSYHIRSVYFDTPEDKALQEKIAGISERQKFRIRVYNFDFRYIRLEKKVKKAGLGYKVSTSLSYEQTQKILCGDLDWIKDSADGLLWELREEMTKERLRPKTIVDYRRNPFIFAAGNVRVTLDYEIKTGVFSHDFLNPELPMIPANKDTVIMEVKYDNYLPDLVRDLMQIPNRREGAFSKYATCRRFG